MRRALIATIIGFCIGLCAQSAGAQAPLAVCFNEDAAPYSSRAHGGFDLSVAQSLADKLGRKLQPVWFESKLDEDSSGALEANALLSDGHCDLVAGYPLSEDALEKPGTPSARLPEFDGFKPSDRRRKISLGELKASRPYHFAPLAVVLGPSADARHVSALADLQGLKIGIEGGTLADTILMTWRGGEMIDAVTHFIPGRDQLWPALERGEFAATLTPLHRFDAWRAAHPDTAIRDSGYRFPVGFNLGFVGLASRPELMAEVDGAIEQLTAGDALAKLARDAGMTYAAPQSPSVRKRVVMSDLQAP
jgi:ABC-type amino acid transport substrate-binding protein